MTDIATSISVLPALASAPQTGLQNLQDRAGATEAAGQSPDAGQQSVEAVAGAADKPALDSSTDERKSPPQDGRGERVDITV
jgi:hypothetical protein